MVRWGSLGLYGVRSGTYGHVLGGNHSQLSLDGIMELRRFSLGGAGKGGTDVGVAWAMCEVAARKEQSEIVKMRRTREDIERGNRL